MKVYVVCQNDFPVEVFDSEEAANDWTTLKERQDEDVMQYEKLYYHVHAFELTYGQGQ